MKRIAILIAIISLVVTLSGCSARPFEGSDGMVFKEGGTISFDYNNGTEIEEVYFFDFNEELYYFEGPFDNSFSFTAINNYKTASTEMKRLIDSLDMALFDRLEGDYGDTITLSLKASETNYNEIKLDIASGFDVDAYFTTEDGVDLIFFYTEFDIDGEIIVVPNSIYAFVHQIYKITGVESVLEGSDNVTADVKLRYESFIVPVPPRSSVSVDSKIPNLSDSIESYINLTVDDDLIICNNDTSFCYEETTSLVVKVHESYTEDDVYDFYLDNFDGEYNSNGFLFHNLGQTFILEANIINGDLVLNIDLVE